MTIKCGIVGEIPYYLTPGDEFQIDFDISTWLGSDQISSVSYSAIDENGDTATACFDSDKSDKTTTVFQPYIKAGSTDNKRYILKCAVTTASAYVKAFYILINVNSTKAKNDETP